MAGGSPGVSIDAALVAIVWVPAQPIVVTVSRMRVRRERAMDRVLRAILRGRGNPFFGGVRRLVARYRSILWYRRILGSGGYRYEDGQGKG